MAQLRLVAAPDEGAVNEAGDASAADPAALLADLEHARDGTDRELALRAARCIRHLVRQRECAAARMQESAALLQTALERLQSLDALIRAR